uniref:Uncharacterized protein n=1 Tax=Amblyomma triste TaxID=251400 RepID=A0A023G589_AMBTT
MSRVVSFLLLPMVFVLWGRGVHLLQCRAAFPLQIFFCTSFYFLYIYISFVQKNSMTSSDDLFQVKKSDQVVEFLDAQINRSVQACSIDTKDLYYSLPQKELLSCIEDSIDRFGLVAFQNAVCLSIEMFLELLALHIGSTFVSWKDTYFQKQGMLCIGSCLAPVDIFLGQVTLTTS